MSDKRERKVDLVAKLLLYPNLNKLLADNQGDPKVVESAERIVAEYLSAMVAPSQRSKTTATVTRDVVSELVSAGLLAGASSD